MKLRELIIRITGTLIFLIIITIILLSIAYKIPKKYTCVIDGKFLKSNNCYVDASDNRVCKIKGGLKKVEMFYVESD